MMEYIFNQYVTNDSVAYTSMHHASGPRRKQCATVQKEIYVLLTLHQCSSIHRRGNARLPTYLVYISPHHTRASETRQIKGASHFPTVASS